MQDTSGIKAMVLEALDSKGLLSTLRSQIRASVSCALEEGEPGLFEWENPKARKIAEDKELCLLAQLFENLLEFYGLDYSLSALKNELGPLADTDTSALGRLISRATQTRPLRQNPALDSPAARADERKNREN